MAAHNELGKRGEDIAVEFLTEKGYTVLVRNWKRQYAEIDIVVSDSDHIVFVEVKTRSSRIWGEPIESVSEQKMKNIIKAASLYLEEHETGDLEPRFDVVSVVPGSEVEHIEDAFYPTLE